MVTAVSDVSDFIKMKVSQFKAIPIDSIDLNASLVDEIGLIGDDFAEIEYLIRKKFDANTDEPRYVRDLSINKWAEIVASHAS